MTEHIRFSTGIASAIVATILSNPEPTSRQLARDVVPPMSSRVTFNRDIAPILIEHCVSCHQPDRGAPFTLVTFEDARPRAAGIELAVRQRHMPPWLPTHGVVDFVGERRLTDQQIALIHAWVQQGAREGDPADRRAPAPSRSGWQLGEPDLLLEMPESYQLPASGSDVYRNFVIPVGIAERRYVRAVELRPDNPGVVHHAVVTIDRTRWSRYRDAQDPEPGYDGMLAGQAESPDGHFIAWTPGRTVRPEPDDMAWRLDRGSDLVVQLHMAPAPQPRSVRVRIGLLFARRPPTRIPVMLRVGPKDLDIAAGRRSYVAEDEYVLPVDVDLLSVYPHAHYLARTMTAFARLPDGAIRPLLEIPAWDFHWQDEYRYARPVPLPKGTTVVMRFEYDNSDGNPHNPHHPARRVTFGPSSSDEMSDLWLQVLPRGASDQATLQRALSNREALADIVGYETLLRARPNDVATRTLLGALFARVGRHAEAEREYRAALDVAPRDWLAHYNLGIELQSRGRLDAADAEYGAALNVNPQAAEPYYARGQLLYSQLRFADAIERFREAIRIWPDYADAYNSFGSALAKTGYPDRAIAAYRTALEIQPDHVPALNNLGILLATGGEIDEAIKALRHAVAVAPSHAESRTNLAAALAIQAGRGRRK